MRNIAVAFLIVVASTGCYHATVQTGVPAAPEHYSKWAHSWLFGLVPPSTLNVAERCPVGASSVETMLSFPNQVVNILTGGIYTPMTIKVVCAAPR